MDSAADEVLMAEARLDDPNLEGELGFVVLVEDDIGCTDRKDYGYRGSQIIF